MLGLKMRSHPRGVTLRTMLRDEGYHFIGSARTSARRQQRRAILESSPNAAAVGADAEGG